MFVGLAVIAAAMANRGTMNGVTVLGESGWKALHAEAVTRPTFFNFTTSFTQGGVNQDQPKTDRNNSKKEHTPLPGTEGFFGWMGLGGSIFQV